MGAILVVDDNDDFRIELCRSLSKRYPRVTIQSADYPSLALEMFVKDRFAFDLIITDMEFGDPAHDGCWLINQINLARESRGYDPAPYLVALTVEPSYKRDFAKIEDLGARFAPKTDPDFVFAAVDESLNSLKAARFGPHFIIEHKLPRTRRASVSISPVQKACCVKGERIIRIGLARDHRPEPELLKMGPGPRLLLDLLGSTTRKQHSFTWEEIYDLIRNDDFYRDQLLYYLPFSNPASTIRMYLKRLRGKLQVALNGVFDVNKVLITEYYDYNEQDELIDDPEVIALLQRRTRGKSVGKVRLPKVVTRYRLAARCEVRHS